MEPLDRNKFTVTNSVATTSNPVAVKLVADSLYTARLVQPSAGSAQLLLATQPTQSLVFNQAPALPPNVPLQLRFQQTSNENISVNVMQWRGPPQALALSVAQTQFLQQTQNIQQLAQQIAKGEAIQQLAGEAFKMPITHQPVQLNLLPLPPSASPISSTPAALLTALTQSAVYLALSPSLQQLLLQPDNQAALLQQLHTQATYLQLGDTFVTLDPKQRTLLQTLLTPLVQQQAQSQVTQSSAMLLIQPLKALPDVLLNPTMLATSLHLLQSASRAISSSVSTGGFAEPQTSVTASSSLSSVLKSAFSSLKEDLMKAVNLEKVLASANLATEATGLKLQPGELYFARLQQLATQQAQFIVQTAQGPVKLALNTMPALPTDVPLQLSFNLTQSGKIALDIKVLTTLPHTLPLTKAQAALLADPKQLALLQQRLVRGETITQLAGSPLKLPVLAANTLQLTLLPPTDKSNNSSSAASSSGQLSIQAVSSEQKLQLSNSDFLKPQLLASSANEPKAPGSVTAKAESSQVAWRQLLPMLENAPASLRNLPDMPAAVQQLLSLVRQAQPDSSKVLSATQVAEQLQASLQFQPLQLQPNLGTAAGTLAVAIQLLLGQLLRQPQTAAKAAPAQRLAQAIGQLDQQQTSQLLRALGSHSSALQLAQLQNADAAGIGQQWIIPLALQQQQESRLSQILIEQREAEHPDPTEQRKMWQLTMKFDLGNHGQLMAVAKLRETDLQLHFYTNEPQALRQAEKFLPLLTERCTAQGLTVSEAHCQLGKIPDTLGNRRTSLISTKA